MPSFFTKKIIAVAIIISIIGTIAPQKTYAMGFVFTGDLLNLPIMIKEQIKDFVADPLSWMTSKVTAQMVGKAMFSFASKGMGGGASFITNLKQFGQDNNDKTFVSIFQTITSGSDSSLCPSFSSQVKKDLVKKQQKTSVSNKIKCSTENYGVDSAAYDSFVSGDFENGGGWDAWFAITQNPENNYDGAMILAESDINYEQQAEANRQELEATAQSMYKSDKDTKGNTKTPGTLVKSGVEQAFGNPMEILNQIDEWNELLGGLVAALAVNTLNQGLMAINQTVNGFLDEYGISIDMTELGTEENFDDGSDQTGEYMIEEYDDSDSSYNDAMSQDFQGEDEVTGYNDYDYSWAVDENGDLVQTQNVDLTEGQTTDNKKTNYTSINIDTNKLQGLIGGSSGGGSRSYSGSNISGSAYSLNGSSMTGSKTSGSTKSSGSSITSSGQTGKSYMDLYASNVPAFNNTPVVSSSLMREELSSANNFANSVTNPNAPTTSSGEASKNITYGRFTEQSSTEGNYRSSQAIDGDRTGTFQYGYGGSQTKKEVSPWWRIDLGPNQYVDQINIYPRTDVGGSVPIRVVLYPENLVNGIVVATTTLDYVNPIIVPVKRATRWITIEAIPMTSSSNTSAWYNQSAYNDFVNQRLELAEVEVYKNPTTRTNNVYSPGSYTTQ